MTADALTGGFADAPRDAARAFRAALNALARPGRIEMLAGAVPPAPLSVAAGTLLLTLADGTLAGARKGSGNYHLIVTGRAAHAGRAFDEGRNAVAGAAIIAAALHGLNGQHEGVTVNVAKISGGGALNVVADNAVVRFNVRVPDKAAADWIDASVRAIAATPPTR